MGQTVMLRIETTYPLELLLQLLHSPGQDDVHGIVLYEGLVIEIGMRATGVAAHIVIVGRAHDVRVV